MGFEDKVPPVPNRDQEIALIKATEKSFQDQPLYKFYMNEALRLRKMNYASKLNDFRKEWALNFCYSALIFSVLFYPPMAYSFRHTNLGTPHLYVPKGRIWKQVYNQNRNWKRSKWYTVLVFGAAVYYAHTYTDRSQIQDEYYNDVGVILPKVE